MSEPLLVESSFEDLQDELDDLARQASKLIKKYPKEEALADALEDDEMKEVFLDFARDTGDHDAHERCTDWLEDLEEIISSMEDEGMKVPDIKAFHKKMDDLFDDIDDGDYEEEDEDEDSAEGDDGHVYTEPDAVRFVNDMQRKGYDVHHYKGRFYWEGPSVQTSRKHGVDLDDIIKATRVKLQWDNMGLDLVVYPVKKDAGKKGSRHESIDHVNTFALGSSPAANGMRALIETTEGMLEGSSWLDKKVKNPRTGNMVKVSSLDPKDQERYRPKKSKSKVSSQPEVSRDHVRWLANMAHGNELHRSDVQDMIKHHKGQGTLQTWINKAKKTDLVKNGPARDRLDALWDKHKKSVADDDDGQEASIKRSENRHVAKAMDRAVRLQLVDGDDLAQAIQDGEEIDWVGWEDDILDNAETRAEADKEIRLLRRAKKALGRYKG